MLSIIETMRKRIGNIRRTTGSDDLDYFLRSLLNGDIAAISRLTALRRRSWFEDDFLAAGIDTKFSSTAGSGTGNAAFATVAGAVNGEVTLKSASNDGTNAANFSITTLDQVNFKANQGGCFMACRVKVDDVSEACLLIGFTDTISTTVEAPFFMNAAVIDSDATDACGLMWDVDATVDRIYLGGVKGDTDTDPLDTKLTMADAVYKEFAVAIDKNGTVHGWVDGSYVGSVANAVTVTVALTPFIAIGNRSANQVVATVDWFTCAQDR